MNDVPEFTIERDKEAGLFVASWDDPAGGGITTQGKDLRELSSAIEEAVRCRFRRTHSAARGRTSL
jgi:predicted RNase H-like HicB family nuclease